MHGLVGGLVLAEDGERGDQRGGGGELGVDGEVGGDGGRDAVAVRSGRHGEREMNFD